MRDQQRQRLYDAERRAEIKLRRMHKDSATPGSRAMDVGLSRIPDEQCQMYVDEICDHVHVKRVDVRLVPTEGHAAKYSREECDEGCAEIVLPPWARAKITILHEVAHHLTHRYYPGHGAEFVENFLMLVRTFLSPTVSQVFLDEFLADGIEVKSSGKQGLRFLAYALKLKNRGKGKRVVVITSEPKRYVGWIINFERNGKLLLGRCEDHRKPQHEIASEDVRYATWWAGAA